MGAVMKSGFDKVWAVTLREDGHLMMRSQEEAPGKNEPRCKVTWADASGASRKLGFALSTLMSADGVVKRLQLRLFM